MSKDIKGIDDIKLMVDVFYQRVREDQLLAPIFIYRLSDHWEPHLKKMYTFWNAVLFGVKDYQGNPFMKHATMDVGKEHFERWLKMFNTVIEENFEGPVAEEAKKRAEIMAVMFQQKMAAIRKSGTRPIF